MLKVRALSSLLFASIVVVPFVAIALPAAADTSIDCPKGEEIHGSKVRKTCSNGNTPPKSSHSGVQEASNSDTSGGPAPICLNRGAVVPCTTDAGIWTGDCYLGPINPQPPYSDPIWMGRNYGVILRCTSIPLGNNLGITPATAYANYWAPAPPGVTFDPVALARRAVAEMELTTPPIGMAPAPDLDDPNVLITMPAHFWLTGDAPNELGPATVSASDAGLTVTVTATLTGVTFDTGDGGELTCTRAEIAAAPADPTAPPVCGHTWEHPSDDQPGGVYTVTATSHWAITWTGGGQTGTLDMDTDASLDVAVTDLPVHLVTGRG